MGPGGLARALRVVVVGLVLCAEFGFVLWLYHLDDHVAQQRAAVAQVLAVGAPGSAESRVEDAVASLEVSGAPAAAAVRRAAAGDLDDPADRARLVAAARASADGVEQRQRTTDLVVVLGLLSLFLVVCAGWFTWFGRLARRHRRVQHALTEREVAAAGERRLQALVHHSADVVAVLDDDAMLTFVSTSARAVLGRDPEELRGTRVLDLLEQEDQELLARLLLSREEAALVPVALEVVHPDARRRSVEGTLHDLRGDPAVGGWVLTLRDVTDRRRLETSLAHQALHDSLTGLANRQLFTDRLEHARAPRDGLPGRSLVVLLVDLDDFKLVNDSRGHQVGDALLVAVSQRITTVLRPQDTAARLGGDEFAILLEDADLADGADVAERLLAALADPFEVGGQQHSVTASIGVAGHDARADVSPGDGVEGVVDLVRDADVAMYHAKERGKGGVALYDAAHHTRALDELRLRGELAEAVDAGQLVLHYQPIVDLRTEEITGFEALVRWQHPERGLVYPGDFIAVAEQSGLVVPMGRWVLHQACATAAVMQRGGGRPSMSVNVAVQQLADPDFHASVVEALADARLPAERLVLEITESTLLADVPGSVAVLGALRGLGVRVAIDDFGTGYNSLAQLAHLPVDVLKVDKSFVDRLDGDDGDASLVEAVLALSAAMRLVTVAEGVEQAHQARWLRSNRALLGQGYLWSRPVDAAAALGLLRRGVPRSGAAEAGPEVGPGAGRGSATQVMPAYPEVVAG